MSKRKVLFVSNLYRDFVVFHKPYIKLFQEWGYEVHVVASPYGSFKEELEQEGVICHDIPFVRSPFSLKNIKAFFELKRLLESEKFCLIHVHTPIPAWIGRLAAKLTKQHPVLYTAHGFHFFKGAPLHYWLFFYPAEWIASRWTDGLIVINLEDLERAKGFGLIEGKNLFFVHGVGVDIKNYSQNPIERGKVRRELGIEENSVVVTCVAEFIKRKNHEFLLEAWKSLREKTKNATLILVGEGELRKKLENKVKMQNLNNVMFLGFRKDIPRILQATDIAVLPSKQEGLPKAIMEAMASGIPVVATDVRGSRDLVDNGVTGFLVKLGDVKDFANKLLILIENPDLRKQMGNAAREKIKEYSLEKVLEEMKEIYRKFLKCE